ncbi:cell wall-binding repeat-containing protein [Clostridium sp. HMP27]|uniref:cell wall-binding repeat-containing protein n=1 Tax=Clostridium sp. HMP27 TaxID=1487921 RepID=UPI00068F5538|nr:cell wall-binding repeat-containing protein [Clostridium sp. HMP27]
MSKIQKNFLTTFIAAILISNALFSFFPLSSRSSLNKVYAANSKINIPLGFTPTHSIIHPNKPILYFTDRSARKVYSINYETGETKSIQFDLPIERLTFSNNEVYVTILKSGHHYSNLSAGDGAGAVGIIDADNFTLKDRFDVDIDPFDIAVDMEGFIYLFGGSNQWTVAKSYSRETHLKIDTVTSVHMRSYIEFNPNQDKLYTITTDVSPRDFTVYGTKSGDFTRNIYGSPYHGDYEMLPKFRISPDGKYIFNAAGTIFKTSDSMYGDMTYVTSLNANFFDIAFNTKQNTFYAAVEGNKIAEHDYSNFNILKYYTTLGKVDSLFSQNDTLIAVSKNNNNEYFIESILLESSLPIDDNDELHNKYKDIFATVKYDVSRNKAYALDKTLNNLLVMDIKTNKLERTINLLYTPSDLAISEDFSNLYIVNEDENYLVSVYDLNDFSNTKNLSCKIEKNSSILVGHRHIYEKNNRLYIVNGEWSPKLLVFDSNTFNEINYTPRMEEVGNISFSSDGKYIYKWTQYGWSAGSLTSEIAKYLTDGDKITEIEKSNIGYTSTNEKLSMYRDPLDTPIMVLEKKGLIICKDKVFNINNLSKPIRSFNEPIYAVDEDRSIAVGKSRIYNLDTMETVRYMPNYSNNIFFDKDGKLHFFTGKDMYSIDPFASVSRFEALRSMPENNEKDNPIDFPIVIQYQDKINLVNEKNISISDGKNYYKVKASVSGNMLIIAHEDLPYNSNITLIVEEDTVGSVDEDKFNGKFTLNFYTGEEYNRISGLNRYETSIEVSKQWSSSKYAVLASGQDFPDALSASPLAAKYNAPILLTNPKTLATKTEMEIKRLGVSEMFIIGGYGSVSKEIEDKIASNGIKITRLHGNDRYQTSLSVANFIGTNGEIFITAGSNFPDALSIASYAAAQGIPIVLTGKDSLPIGLEKYVSDYDISKTYVIGGPGVINDNLLIDLRNPERIYGNNRYETNLKVLSRFKFYFGTTFIASGQGFADALSASALAGLVQSPILLADKSLLNKNEILLELRSIRQYMKMKYTIGGEASVPSSVLDKIFK